MFSDQATNAASMIFSIIVPLHVPFYVPVTTFCVFSSLGFVHKIACCGFAHDARCCCCLEQPRNQSDCLPARQSLTEKLVVHFQTLSCHQTLLLIYKSPFRSCFQRWQQLPSLSVLQLRYGYSSSTTCNFDADPVSTAPLSLQQAQCCSVFTRS